jgi:hypothetical protein
MTDIYYRVVACVKAVSPEPKFIHCSIHKESSAMKKMLSQLRPLLEESVKNINFIKAHTLN